ncbi:MAG: class D sortase [Erysipelotrichaceae bacterium]
MVAFLVVPLLFCCLEYGFFYFSLKPLMDPIISAASLLIADEAIDFNDDLNSIYVEQDFSERGTVPLSEVVIPFVGTYYARIESARVGLSVRLYWGDSLKILRKGAGQYTGSNLPGFQKPLLIGGHNITVFNPIQNMIVGDLVTINTNYGQYIYEVYEIAIKKSNDTEAFNLQRSEEILILYSCYPFHILRSHKYDRFIVYGRRISGPDVK